MRLSDVMSAANLTIYAEVGLVLFLLVFLAVAARVLWPRPGAYEKEAWIPLMDEPVVPRDREAQARGSEETR